MLRQSRQQMKMARCTAHNDNFNNLLFLLIFKAFALSHYVNYLQVLESIEKSYDNTQSPESLRQVSSHFREALSLENLEHDNDTKVWELACLKALTWHPLFIFTEVSLLVS